MDSASCVTPAPYINALSVVVLFDFRTASVKPAPYNSVLSDALKTASETGIQSSDQSSALSLSGVSNEGKYAQTDIKITMSDYGAINSAMTLVGENVDNVLMYGAGLTEAVLSASDNTLLYGAGLTEAVLKSNSTT